MSFKYAAQKISDYEWVLEKGVPKPITIFMNQFLYDQSEEEMWRQATWATNIPSVEKIIITPDAHVGAGVPVGIVVATKDYIAPCAAGYDISCGMILLKTKLVNDQINNKEKKRAIMKSIEERISLGIGQQRTSKQIIINKDKFLDILQYGLLALNVPEKICNKFEKTHHKVNKFVHYDKAFNRGINQLSSLGSGNHFWELQQSENGEIWVMIHTGSRGYGHQIATEFFNEGFEWWNNNFEKKINKNNKELVCFPVDSDIGIRYLNAMNQAANFAIVNRFLIAQATIEAINEITSDIPEIYYEISHNLVQLEQGLWIHRKGATRALPANHELLKGTGFENTGHPILIPGSMGTSSAVLFPKNSINSLYSINHGCGRVMSRGNANKNLDQDIINKEMTEMDILYNSRNAPKDESFHCYKNIDQVLETVEGSNLAKVSFKLYPRAVIKGND
ncbi:MAG: RtcB family protein [Candidatus Nanoarchaeia archaeon]|jgi:tRNA-splicing ligase RtcB|nr:RtcB family protein [Candidatus Nanoarchaeia archaeon]